MERIFFLWARCGWIGASEEERMKFGIIGAGRIGKIHGGNVAARSDSEVAFVADADPAAGAALAKATGAKVAKSKRSSPPKTLTRSPSARRPILTPISSSAPLAPRKQSSAKSRFTSTSIAFAPALKS